MVLILALFKALWSLLVFKGLVLIINVRLTVYSPTSINNTQSNVDNHTQSKQAILEHYTNSEKSKIKVHENILRSATITQT